MKIESIIRRPKGHEVTFDRGTAAAATYQFRPDNSYIAEVANPDHAQRLLCIREGYRIAAGAAPAAVTAPAGRSAVVVPPKAPAATGLLGSSVHPAIFNIGGTEYALGDIVGRAFAASGLTEADWNALEADERHERIDDELNRLAEAADAAGAPATGDLSPEAERDELADEYKRLFGKLPSGKMKTETIREKIAEAKANPA